VAAVCIPRAHGISVLTCGRYTLRDPIFSRTFLAALRWNPLGLHFCPAFSIFDAYAFTVLITRSHRLRSRIPLSATKSSLAGLFWTCSLRTGHICLRIRAILRL